MDFVCSALQAACNCFYNSFCARSPLVVLAVIPSSLCCIVLCGQVVHLYEGVSI